jgi:formylglycine-generating enzyme required for sulfatase activity
LNNPLGLTNWPYTSPVGYYPAYGYGMCDMAGNVWEWTSSIYGGSFRVFRGGSWFYYDYNCTVSDWAYYDLGNLNFYLGFRVCR